MTIGFARNLIHATANVLTLQRQRYFRYLIPLSVSPTCSRAAVVLTSTSSIPSWSLTFLNSMSIIIVRTLKPLRAYKLVICFRDLRSCIAFQLGTCSQVYILIPLERETKNAIPFTNITSAVRVTYLWRSYSYPGMPMYSRTTLCGFCQLDKIQRGWSRSIWVYPGNYMSAISMLL